MTEIRNNKQRNKKNGFGPCLEFVIWNLWFIWNLVLEIWNLFVIWCLEFVILDTKLQGRAGELWPPAMRDRHGPSKIPHCGEGPGFSGQNKLERGHSPKYEGLPFFSKGGAPLLPDFLYALPYSAQMKKWVQLGVALYLLTVIRMTLSQYFCIFTRGEI